MIKRIFRAIIDWGDRHWLEFFGLGSVGLLLVIVLWPLIIYNIQPGHVGVLWYRFFGGTVTDPDRTLGEGLHIIFPWDKIYVYDARLQRIDETVTGLSIDGLNISVNVSSRYVIERTYAGYLHKAIGPSYPETLMRPQLRTLVLTYISENEASDLYSTRRARIQTVIETQFQAALANISTNVPFEESYVNLEDVLIEEIRLPAFVRQAIEQKEKVRHMSEAYEFRLQLEEKERQRKRIEAEGIRSFQEIVAPGITDSYLRWRGIEATLQLSKSNNAKVVIIGNSADGLPIILNTESFQGVPPNSGAAEGKVDGVGDLIGPQGADAFQMDDTPEISTDATPADDTPAAGGGSQGGPAAGSGGQSNGGQSNGGQPSGGQPSGGQSSSPGTASAPKPDRAPAPEPDPLSLRLLGPRSELAHPPAPRPGLPEAASNMSLLDTLTRGLGIDTAETPGSR